MQRQANYISQLQDELKNAKIVLQDRNLRGKFFESLGEYKKDIERAKAEATKESAADILHRRASSVKKESIRNRPAIISKPSHRRSTKPNSASRNPRIHFDRTGGSIFNTFDLSLRSFTPSNHNPRQTSFASQIGPKD